MLNLSLLGLISLVLIYQNILLLNEETLILVCFIMFCWVMFTKFSESIYNELVDRSLKIENSLTTSLTKLLQVLSNSIEIQNKFKNLSFDFETLGNHFFKLSSAISNQLPLHVTYKSELIYPKKLFFTQRLEQQTTKLLALLLSQKLNKLVSIKKFYTSNLKISIFLCIDKIILREYLQII